MAKKKYRVYKKGGEVPKYQKEGVVWKDGKLHTPDGTFYKLPSGDYKKEGEDTTYGYSGIMLEYGDNPPQGTFPGWFNERWVGNFPQGSEVYKRDSVAYEGIKPNIEDWINRSGATFNDSNSKIGYSYYPFGQNGPQSSATINNIPYPFTREYLLDRKYGNNIPGYQEGGFTPHIMINPETGEEFLAETNADHLRYSDMGYVHEDEMRMGGYIDQYKSGGYTVSRSNDRKGKTHKVTRKSDGKTEYYGHSMRNQPKNKKVKEAAEARHRAQGNFKNPFFKAYWDATWQDGGYVTDDFMIPEYKKGGINIKPENKGKFTKKANAAGMSIQEYARKVLAANEGVYDPSTRRQANFARNASRWNKSQYGGPIWTEDMMVSYDPTFLSRTSQPSKFEFGGIMPRNQEYTYIEAEDGEIMLSKNGELNPIKGKRHYNGGVKMLAEQGGYIFSDTEKMKFDKNKLKKNKIDYNIVDDYSYGGPIFRSETPDPFYVTPENKLIPETLDQFVSHKKGKVTPSDIVKGIIKKFSYTDKEGDIFEDTSKDLNIISRMPFLQEAARLQEARKPKRRAVRSLPEAKHGGKVPRYQMTGTVSTDTVRQATRDVLPGVEEGRRRISLDFNSSKNKNNPPNRILIVIPDDASPEEIRLAKEYAIKTQEFFRRHGHEMTLGGTDNTGIIKRKDNIDAKGNPRGVKGYFHTEPFFAGDTKAANIIANNREEYSGILYDTLGKISGAEFIAPHKEEGKGAEFVDETLGPINETDFARDIILPSLAEIDLEPEVLTTPLYPWDVAAGWTVGDIPIVDSAPPALTTPSEMIKPSGPGAIMSGGDEGPYSRPSFRPFLPEVPSDSFEPDWNKINALPDTDDVPKVEETVPEVIPEYDENILDEADPDEFSRLSPENQDQVLKLITNNPLSPIKPREFSSFDDKKLENEKKEEKKDDESCPYSYGSPCEYSAGDPSSGYWDENCNCVKRPVNPYDEKALKASALYGEMGANLFSMIRNMQMENIANKATRSLYPTPELADTTPQYLRDATREAINRQLRPFVKSRTGADWANTQAVLAKGLQQMSDVETQMNLTDIERFNQNQQLRNQVAQQNAMIEDYNKNLEFYNKMNRIGANTRLLRDMAGTATDYYSNRAAMEMMIDEMLRTPPTTG